MFDIGWSELVVIGVVALIAIGPKELPGVLRMVGQWMGKVRRMAAEFQGQFQEALREAELADVKKQFDDIKETAGNITSGNVFEAAKQDVEDALKAGDPSTPATPAELPTTPEQPAFETLAEEEKAAEVQVAESATVGEPSPGEAVALVQPEPVPSEPVSLGPAALEIVPPERVQPEAGAVDVEPEVKAKAS